MNTSKTNTFSCTNFMCFVFSEQSSWLLWKYRLQIWQKKKPHTWSTVASRGKRLCQYQKSISYYILYLTYKNLLDFIFTWIFLDTFLLDWLRKNMYAALCLLVVNSMRHLYIIFQPMVLRDFTRTNTRYLCTYFHYICLYCYCMNVSLMFLEEFSICTLRVLRSLSSR